jgi:methyl-accepting chemotaxis protein
MKISISGRLVAIGVGAVLATSLVGLTGYSAIRQNAAALQEVLTAGQAQLSFMRGDMMHDAVRADVLESIHAHDQAGKAAAAKSFAEHRETFNQAIADNMALPLPEEIRTALQEVGPAMKNYLERAEAMLALSEADGIARWPEFSKVFDELADRQEAVSKVIDETASKRAAESRAAVAQAAVMIVATGLGATLLLAGGIWMTRRAIVSGLRRFAEPMNALANADFTVKFDDARGDEFGALGSAGNRMIGDLRSAFSQVAQSSQQVAAAATELSATAEQIAAGMKQQAEHVQEVTGAVELVSTSISAVAKTGADASSRAVESGRQATQGGELVAKTVEQVTGVAAEVDQTARAIAELGRKGEQIGQIISVINDIADQTNLLALNAAIEAARAGEHGRGFAVVADEVRKLAERTTNATEEVATAIREIQTGTADAVQRMDRGRHQVDESVQMARASGEAMRQIVQGQQALQELVRGIADSADRQGEASHKIAESVSAMSASTKESARGAEQSAEAATTLSEQAESLRSLVARFRV